MKPEETGIFVTPEEEIDLKNYIHVGMYLRYCILYIFIHWFDILFYFLLRIPKNCPVLILKIRGRFSNYLHFLFVVLRMLNCILTSRSATFVDDYQPERGPKWTIKSAFVKNDLTGSFDLHGNKGVFGSAMATNRIKLITLRWRGEKSQNVFDTNSRFDRTNSSIFLKFRPPWKVLLSY